MTDVSVSFRNFDGHVGAHPDGHQHGAFTECTLLFWVSNFLKCFACEKSYWPESWQGSFYINLIHFSDSGIYRLIFIFASATVKTSNKTKRVSGVNLVWNHTWVILKSDECAGRVRFDIISMISDQNCTTRQVQLPLYYSHLKFQDSVSAKI